MKTLGQLIKDYRQSHDNMSLRDFAGKCGVSHSYIDKLEKGIDTRTGKPVVPTLDTIEKISKALNMPVEQVLMEIGFAFYSKEKELSHKDEKDVEKLLNNTMAYLENQEGLMLSGEPMDENDLELLKQAIKNGLEYAKISNKKKYTPKKYQKE